MTSIFVHIPRTGGTVFTELVRESVDKGTILHFDLDSMDFEDGMFAPSVRRTWDMKMMYFIDGSRELHSIVSRLTGLNSGNHGWIMGHITYNTHRVLPSNNSYRYISIVRDPVDRVWSYFNLMMQPKSRSINRLDSLFVKYEDNLGKIMDSQEFPEFSNDQSRMLFGRDVSNDFGSIRDVINHVQDQYFYVGVTENLEKMIQDIGFIYSWTKFDVPKKEVRWDPISPELANKIRKYNIVDYALWRYVFERGHVGTFIT